VDCTRARCRRQRFRLADDRDDGRRLIERAAAIFEEIGATGWSAETSAALA
jgi:hypothetical protein